MAEQREVRQAGGSETKQETWGKECELNNDSPEELLPPDDARRSIGIFRYAILRLREKISQYFIQMLTTNPAFRQITAVIAAQVAISLVFETLLLDKASIKSDFNEFFNKLANIMRHSLPEGVVLERKIVTDLSEVPESGDHGTLLVVCKKATGKDNNHYGIYIVIYNSQNKPEIVYQNFKNSPGKPLNPKLDPAVSKIKNRFKQNSNNGNDGGNRNNRGDDNNRKNRKNK